MFKKLIDAWRKYRQDLDRARYEMMFSDLRWQDFKEDKDEVPKVPKR